MTGGPASRPRLGTSRIIALALAAYVVFGLVTGSVTIRTVITIVLFVVILGGLILIHEVGHFLAARMAGVRVSEFGVGFPPRARILRARGETTYTLNWLPIGGFVKLEGEDGDSASAPRAFSAKPLHTRLLILVAGVVINVVVSFALFTAISLAGDPAIGVTVPYVDPGSPADKAGLVVGDVIERLDGKAYGGFPDSVTILDALRSKGGQTVVLTVRHADGSVVEKTATLRSPADIAAGKGALGIGKQGAPVEARRTADTVRYTVPEAVGAGVSRTGWAMGVIVNGIRDLFVNMVAHPTEAPQASGPLGIAQTIGDVFWTAGIGPTLFLAAVLSANLAVFNAMPFPPLDGGRMLMLVLKRIFGTRISLRAERLTYLVGFVVIFAFIIWVTAFDILRGLGGG